MSSSFIAEPVYVRRVTNKATLPDKATPGAAGLDLYSSETVIIPAYGRTVVPTDLQVQISAGSYGRIAPRSGLAFFNALHIGGGVIDSDYRGDLKIIVFNLCGQDCRINKGKRIAQLIIEIQNIFYLIILYSLYLIK